MRDMVMQAGKLRHRVTIQSYSETRDTYGEVTRTWSTLAIVWASIEPLTGRERWNTEQVQPELTHRIRARYQENLTLTSANRIVFGARTFHIHSVRNLHERDREWEIMVQEQV